MTTLSSASLSQVSFIEESTPGTTPASALQDVRFKSASLTANTATTADDEIRSDRQYVNAILTDIEPAISISTQLSYNNTDLFFEGALFSDWSTAVSVSATDISAASADNSYNSSSTDFTAQNLVVGQWIKVGGFVTSANNGLVKIVSIATTKIVVSGLTLVNESAGATVTMKGSYIRNGTTKKSYSVQGELSDVTEFQYVKGATVKSLALALSSGSIIECNFEFMGLSAGMTNTSIGTGANTAAPSNIVFNCVGNVADILENGSAMAAPVQALNLTVDNELRSQKAIGTLGNYGIGTGRCAVSGNMNVYFINSDLYDKILANTATSLHWTITDAAGNIYVFDLPNIVLSGGDPTIEGISSDVMQSIDFKALRHSTLGCTIQICKISA